MTGSRRPVRSPSTSQRIRTFIAIAADTRSSTATVVPDRC
jgi:hypothetical protein